MHFKIQSIINRLIVSYTNVCNVYIYVEMLIFGRFCCSRSHLCSFTDPTSEWSLTVKLYMLTLAVPDTDWPKQNQKKVCFNNNSLKYHIEISNGVWFFSKISAPMMPNQIFFSAICISSVWRKIWLIYSWSSQLIEMTLDKNDFFCCCVGSIIQYQKMFCISRNNNKYAEVNISDVWTFIQLKHIIAKVNVNQISIWTHHNNGSAWRIWKKTFRISTNSQH